MSKGIMAINVEPEKQSDAKPKFKESVRNTQQNIKRGGDNAE